MKSTRILLLDVNRASLDTSIDTLEYPLGLVYVGTALKQTYGEQVELRIESFDAKAHKPSELHTLFAAFQPDVLGLRALTMGRQALHDIARLAINEHKIPYVVAGGPHATDSPSDVVGNEAFSCAVIGEGEQTAVELVGKIRSGESFACVPGLAMRDGKGVRFTAPRATVQDLDSLPIPDHKLLDFQRINRGHVDFSFRHNVPHANLFTSRGCPYQCLYCHQVFGKKFRAHSAARMLTEIRTLYERFGITKFQIIDDIFNLDKSRALAIFNGVVRCGIPAVFSFPNGLRGDLIDEEMADAMWQAGVRYAAFAVETGSPRIQKLIRKNLSLERIADAIARTTAKGIVTRGFFMLGFPTETEDEAEMTVEFARSSDLVTALFFTVVYFPGTPLAKLAQEMARYTVTDLGLENDYVSLRDGPYAFSRDALEAIKLKAIRDFFFTPKRLRLWRDVMPNFYNPRDIDAAMLANIISAQIDEDDVPCEEYAEKMHQYFVFAKRFSKKSGFFV
jgi:radical SAM superfamily enzyme YgiQ (UPF0313 family)